jgi:hypothetical protein
MLRSTADYMRSIHLAGIHHMDTGQQMLIGSGLMDLCRHFHILGGGRGRLHMHEQMGRLFIIGFGHMHGCHLSTPCCV